MNSKSSNKNQSLKNQKTEAKNPASKRKRALEIIEELNKLYPHSDKDMNFLSFRNNFELLIMTILSAQTTDSNVNSVRDVLFDTYPTPYDLASADQAELEQIIRPTGFYKTKSKNIIKTSEMLCEFYGGVVPCSMEDLLTLSGVGRKTANIVLNQGFGHVEGIAVDTHVARLSKRFGFTDKNDAGLIEIDLMNLFSEEHWKDINYLFIKHGREICSARSPKCDICTLKKLCDFYKFNNNNSNENFK